MQQEEEKSTTSTTTINTNSRHTNTVKTFRITHSFMKPRSTKPNADIRE